MRWNEGGSSLTEDMTPEQLIAADETTFRVYMMMQLQAIRTTCAARQCMETDKLKNFNAVGRMLLQSLITGAFAVGMLLLTVHVK